MKEFIKGLITLIAALIVFSFTIAIGTVYMPFEIIVRCYSEKSIIPVFRVPLKTIDGMLAAIGNCLHDISVRYDEFANTRAEWIEDSTASIDKTMFGEKNITISAAIGEIETNHPNAIFKRGRKLSAVLNWAFRQTRHAKGSWEKWKALRELEAKNLHGNKSNQQKRIS